MSNFGRMTTTRARQHGFDPAVVMLDGKEVRECYDLDDIEGWVDCYDLTGGHVHLKEDRSGVAVLPRMYGHVEFIPNYSGDIWS